MASKRNAEVTFHHYHDSVMLEIETANFRLEHKSTFSTMTAALVALRRHRDELKLRLVRQHHIAAEDGVII